MPTRAKALLIYGTLALFAAWCLHSFQRDIGQIRLSSLHGGWWAVAVSGLLSLLNYALRIQRWRHYLLHLGHRLDWGFCALSYMAGFAFTLSPGKVGEMVRARYYREHAVPLSDVTAAFFAERLMDLIAILLLALAMLAALPAYRAVMWVGVALIGTVVLALLFMPWQALERTPIKAVKAAATMLMSARRFLSPSMLAGGLLLGLAAWGAEAVGFKLVGEVIQPGALSWAAGIGIYATATLVGALSFLPGGLGSTEAVMASLLYARGFAVPEALLLTLLCRLLTLWLAVLIGWACVWFLRDGR